MATGPSWLWIGLATTIAVGLPSPSANARTGASPDQWPTYGGDPGHTKYSPLDQIT